MNLTLPSGAFWVHFQTMFFMCFWIYLELSFQWGSPFFIGHLKKWCNKKKFCAKVTFILMATFGKCIKKINFYTPPPLPLRKVMHPPGKGLTVVWWGTFSIQINGKQYAEYKEKHMNLAICFGYPGQLNDWSESQQKLYKKGPRWNLFPTPTTSYPSRTLSEIASTTEISLKIFQNSFLKHISRELLLKRFKSPINLKIFTEKHYKVFFNNFSNFKI